jgi:hypothetical protein
MTPIYNGMPVADLSQLQQMMAQQHPGYPPVAMPLTEQRVQAMIESAILRRMAAVKSPLSQFDAIFQRALSSEDFAAFTKYVQTGAPGFDAIMKSDKLDPIAQLLWETIKENMK